MAAAVWVVGGRLFMAAKSPSWYCTMSATACVSAAEPDRQHQMVSWTFVNLSVTRLAMYAPVVVRESAPVEKSVSRGLSKGSKELGGHVALGEQHT